MNKKILTIGLSIFILTIFSSCDKDPVVPNEEELITTVSYTLTPVSAGQKVTLTFKDIDGDGGNAPVITYTGELKTGTTYNGELNLLNEAENPAENITSEIEEEDEDHQLFFAVSGGAEGKMIISYDDKDANNQPVGLKTKVSTTGTGTGKLKITLRHLPNKSASGVSAGNITNAGGETDIEVSFDVVIK
jgi:hypothetical protein